VFNKKDVLYAMVIVLFISAPVLSAEIYLYDDVEINSSKIVLGEIARIETDSDNVYEALSDLELGDAPRPGRSIEMNSELISLYIRNNGFNRSDFNINSNGSIKIQVSSQKLSSEGLFNKVEEALKEKIYNELEAHALKQDAEILIELLSSPGDKNIPDGEINIEFDNEIDRPAGRLNIPVKIYIDGNYYNRVFMTLRVNYLMDVYLLNKDLSRNERVNESDLAYEEKKIDFYPDELIMNLNTEIIEYGVTNRSYQKDQVLKLSMLEYPDVISFNQEVIAEFEQGSVFVTTKVKARGNGSIGEVIEVENIDTGKRIQAEVLNENRVRIIN